MMLRVSLIGLGLILAACHDGATPGGDVTTAPPVATGTARLVIDFPVANSAPSGLARIKSVFSSVRPVVHSYVSPKTQSVSVALTSVNGAPPAKPAATIVNVVAGSDCAAGTGKLTCTVSIDAPVGTDGLQVTTYAQPSGIGGPISKGDTTVSITADSVANASVSLLPVVSAVDVTLNPVGLPVTTAATFTATITARDVTGDTIGGADDYYQPLTVTTEDLGVHVTASPTLPVTLASPAQNTITFTYDGAGSAPTYSFAIGGPVGRTVSYAFSSTVEHLYVVTQFGDAAVYVYDIQPDGTVSGPSRTIKGPDTTLNRPSSIAVDAIGRVYVVNYGTFPLQGDNVAVFAPGADGNVAPIETRLQGSQPFYVSRGAGVFLTRSQTSDPSAVTVLINYDNIQIPNTGPANLIPPYVEPGANGFSSYLGGDSGFLCVSTSTPENGGAGAVACITSPVLWVTGTVNPGSAQIVNGSAVNSVYCCGGTPNALQFLPNGDLVVAYGPSYMQNPSVRAYQLPGVPTSGTDLQPIRSITGSNTGLTSPTAIAYDSHGQLYVADTGNASNAGSVHVYAAQADGNVAPLQQLGGLNYPLGIAIGK